jgi:predicted Zn-dependent protease
MSKINKKLYYLLIFILLVIGFAKCKDIIRALPYGDEILVGYEAYEKLSAVYEAYNRQFTPREEYYIGRTVSAHVLQKRRLYGNGRSALEKYISKIGHTVAMASDRPETYQGYRFAIINSRSLNAFAVPSGYIFITTGLIKLTSDEDELAGVIAHEVVHIVKKHSLESLSEAQRTKAIANLVEFGVKTGLSQDEKLKNLTGVFGGIVKGVIPGVLKGFDADKEREADIEAVHILIRAGYDPNGLKRILAKLNPVYKNKSKSDSIHGNPITRANDVAKVISSYNSKVPQIIEYRNRRFKNIAKGR